MCKIVFCTLMFFVLFSIGCDDDDSVSSPETESYSITITGLPETLTAPLGSEREISFVVAVHSFAGIAQSGIEVSLSVVGDIGVITPVNSNTDDSGMITAIHTVTFTSRSQTIRLLATINEQTASSSYTLVGVSPPTMVTLIPETTELIVPTRNSGRIEIDAVVTDASGVTVPGVKVGFQLLRFDADNPVFGSIFGNTFTDSTGRVSATFRSDQGSGTVFVQVFIDEPGYEEMVDQVPLTIRILEEEPQSFLLEATPNSFTNIHSESMLVSHILVIVKDRFNNGIPNLRVLMTTDIGAISQPELTDRDGRIQVQHILRPSVDAQGMQEDFTATISAMLSELGWIETVEINYSPEEMDLGSLILATDRRFIWADGAGLSYSNLIATLTDAGGASLDYQEIIFTTSNQYSVVQSPKMTDSLGRARTIFDDVGQPSVDERGMPDSVIVTAKYLPMGLESSVAIMIRERNPVTRIDLNAQARQLVASSGDSSIVRAQCYLGNGTPAQDGTEVFFYAEYGHFTQSVLRITGGSGGVETYYVAGNSVRTDTLVAFVQTPLDTTYSNEALIDLIPGPPDHMRIEASPEEIRVGGETVTIEAWVYDIHGNPVRQGTYVMFSSSLGSIGHSAVTDINGKVTVFLNPGMSAGVATITVSTDSPNGPISVSTTVSFLSGYPRSMNISANPDRLQPRGSGGIEASSIDISLFDSFGNLFSTDHPVVVEIIDCPAPPAGPTFGNDEQIIEIISRDGIAQTVFNSGERILSAMIVAYAPSGEDGGDTVRAHTFIQIAGGSPVGMNINVDENGYSAGGGAWEVDVAVNVWDESENPVADGITINFELEPDIGNIQPAVTGNENRRGASEPGMAHSRFIYQSLQTFEETTITATIQDPDGDIVEEFVFILPLQQGELMLNVDPANWMFNPENDRADIRTWAILRDGHGIQINNAPILFTSNRARFWWKDFSNDRFIMFFPDPSRKLTGQVDRQNNEEPGTATVYLRAELGDIFLDPFSLEVQVRIEAVLEGYEDVVAQPRFVEFTRPAN
ncbi:MAG: hypothetical protein HN757_14780 [Calditrichaeota bacterium]|nr:hypothetical protein [Calditrichota bacterium]